MLKKERVHLATTPARFTRKIRFEDTPILYRPGSNYDRLLSEFIWTNGIPLRAYLFNETWIYSS